MALPLYAFTLFVSAFILFLVQPIVGKIILPKLGGTPQVWNTCMVFFQMVLLAGYAYTHNVSTRLTLRQQLMAHAILLLLPLIVLLPFPFAFGGYQTADGSINPHSLWGFVPDLGSNPIPATLGILFIYVALPFVVVATSAPLLQKWFVYTGHPAARDPYFLYGASNFGSMLSLILYPVILEPYLRLTEQGWIYVGGYVCLMVFVLACAATVWNSREAQPKLATESKPAHPAPAAPPATTAEAQTGITAAAPAVGSTGMKPGASIKAARGASRNVGADAPVALSSDDITFSRRLRWVMLAAVPSSLMLGITTHITTDLSPIPVFWLVPLALYLLSFILVFARWPVIWTELPHTCILIAQPFCIALMIIVDVLNLTSDTHFLAFAIFAHVLGFFATTMVCHGELAKDRPSTKHLTEFYLWMSVGGMVGGMFNGLVAPILFKKLWELPLAIFAAALVRPKMYDTGTFDNLLTGFFEGQPESQVQKGPKGKPTASISRGAVANESFVRTMDIVWPVAVLVLTVGLLFLFSTSPLNNTEAEAAKARRNMFIDFGVPLLVACLCMTRPLRIGLSVGIVLLIFQIHQHQGDSSIYSSRSYFGAISVKEYGTAREMDGKTQEFRYRQLIHGHIDHGMNFIVSPADRGNPDKDLSRLATTYYHREGPEGRVMEKFNWFRGKPNTFHSDARLPASLVFNALADLGTGALPYTNLVTAWSEPPYATVGLGTGTMASYGRPYQHVHFYEIDNQIRRLSLPAPTSVLGNWEEYQSNTGARDKIYFTYLEQGIERGASVQVLMGDARLRMALPYENHYLDKTDRGGGPNNFYHMMVVDAFSSDAIPAHLLTQEAFKMYFTKLTEEGILCVHTSNRFVDLPKVVSAVASSLNFAHLRGHDSNDKRSDGHYTSEWVMVARKNEYLKHLQGDSDFLKAYDTAVARKREVAHEKYWQPVTVDQAYVWTDDYYNLLSVVRFR